MNNRSKYLVKNTLVFAIGNFATKFISFFLVPLYTNILSTSEYGTVDLVVTVCTIIVPIFTLNIAEAIMRFSLDKNNNEKQILDIGYFMMLCGIVLGLVIIPIVAYFESLNEYKYLIYLYYVSLIISQILMAALKGQEKIVLYTFGNFLHTFFIACFNILFLMILKMDIKGFFLAYSFSNLIVAVYCWIALGNRLLKKFDIDFALLKDMARYSIVLIPTSFMWWIMNSSDRIMVSNMLGVNENGVYSVAYKLPSLITTIASTFTQAWLFSAIAENKSDDLEEYTNNVHKILFMVLTFCCVFVLAIMKPFLKIYVAKDYYVAWKYTAPLLIGFVFQTMATFISTAYNVNKDSKGFLFSGTLGAIVNIVLNLILIPTIGTLGAAIATCMSYCVVYAYRIIDTRRYVVISWNNFKYYLNCISMFVSAVLVYQNINEIIEFLGIVLIGILMTLVYIKDITPIVKKVLIRKDIQYGKSE